MKSPEKAIKGIGYYTLIVLIPVAAVLFGTGLYSWLRAMMRDKR